MQGIEPLPEYFENEVLDLTGKTHLISWHNTMLYHSNSQAYGVICAGEDITERESLRSELIKNQEMMLTQARSAAMGEMLSLIAHQWRQPLGTISMSASALLADVALNQIEDEEVERQCQMILEQSQYLSRTIEDFRHFFKPKHKPETIRIATLLDELRQIIGKSLEYSSIALNVQCDDTLETTLHARALLQVLINLVRNAQDALNDHHTKDAAITINVLAGQDRLMISICDNGPGIDPIIIDRIFEPYFTTKGEQSGTGLGLYISQMIVQKQLHGTIEVHSQARGICFTLTIPCKEYS
ncbi:MAG: HAMP domain-containing histidine kinase [Campylobacterales bacterium]|nr:HAMP domain-containing histidine kinase [Campylobacterales bacterium]